jgi:hypothetical protein
MTAQQVLFAHGSCLVEVNARPFYPGQPKYTAFVSLLEDDGAIVRPLVLRNGRRIEIHAPSAPDALDSAISYLERRFGAVSEPGRAPDLASSAFGRPVVVED